MDAAYTTKFLDHVRAASAQQKHLDENRHALLGLYEALIRSDFDLFAGYLTDDTELNIAGMGAMDGHWRGRDAVVAAARKNFAQVGEQKPEIESIISQGDSTAVLFRESGVFTVDGRGYRLRALQWFTFAGGRVRRIDEIAAAVLENP